MPNSPLQLARTCHTVRCLNYGQIALFFQNICKTFNFRPVVTVSSKREREHTSPDDFEAPSDHGKGLRCRSANHVPRKAGGNYQYTA